MSEGIIRLPCMCELIPRSKEMHNRGNEFPQKFMDKLCKFSLELRFHFVKISLIERMILKRGGVISSII